MDPITTLYTQDSVSLYFQAENPTWVNFTYKHAILCNAAAVHHLGFRKANFETLALKNLLPS